MEFTHNREIHTILKELNPTTKICKKDSWSVHTCGRKRLASPRLIKLRKDFRPQQVPRQKLVYGAGNRLTTRPDKREAVQRGRKVCEQTAPLLPLVFASKYACGMLRGTLQRLVSNSDRRKRYCFNGGCLSVFHDGDSAAGAQAPVSPDNHDADARPTLPDVASIDVSSVGATALLAPFPSRGGSSQAHALASPLSCTSSGLDAAQTPRAAIFITGTADAAAGAQATLSPIGGGGGCGGGAVAVAHTTSEQADTERQGTSSSAAAAAAAAAAVQQGPPSSASFLPAASQGALRYKKPVNLSALKHSPDLEELPPLQTITARQVIENGLLGYPDCAQLGRFDIKTREIFERASEQPILRYERQTKEHEVVAGASKEDSEGFTEFRRCFVEKQADFYERSDTEMHRYETESRRLFRQKSDTLMKRIEGTKSASHAVGSMQHEIRSQHKREWVQTRKQVYQQWVEEFKQLISTFPNSSAIIEILKFLNEYIADKETADSKALTIRHFELLVNRLSRSSLLLTEVTSILYAMRPVFKLSTEQFVEIIRERLRPLFPKKKDEAGFDREYRLYQVLQRDGRRDDPFSTSSPFRSAVSRACTDAQPGSEAPESCAHASPERGVRHSVASQADMRKRSLVALRAEPRPSGLRRLSRAAHDTPDLDPPVSASHVASPV